jgi:hypothetical protein
MSGDPEAFVDRLARLLRLAAKDVLDELCLRDFGGRSTPEFAAKMRPQLEELAKQLSGRQGALELLKMPDDELARVLVVAVRSALGARRTA